MAVLDRVRMDDRMRILGVGYDNLTAQEALSALSAMPGSSPVATVSYLNLECLRRASLEPHYRAALDASELVLPDGIGLLVATHLVGGRKAADWDVTSLFTSYLGRTARRGDRVFLLGGPAGVAEDAARALARRFPGFVCAGTHPGYFEDSEAVIDVVNASAADVLVVGMGAPTQELWLAEHGDKLQVPVRLAVGGLLMWLSGRWRRPPQAIRTVRLEWLWRVMLEPRRLYKRYFMQDMPFLARIAREGRAVRG